MKNQKRQHHLARRVQVPLLIIFRYARHHHVQSTAIDGIENPHWEGNNRCETRLELFLVFLGFLLFVVVPSTTATQSDAIEVVMLSR